MAEPSNSGGIQAPEKFSKYKGSKVTFWPRPASTWVNLVYPLDSARDRSSSVEPDDHYPLTCTPENGVWMLGNLNTCRFLPLPGSEAKSSNLMVFYEGKKSMSMISWSRKGTQAN